MFQNKNEEVNCFFMSSNERYNFFCMFTPEGKVMPIESVTRSTEHGGVCVALRNKTSGLIIAQNTDKSNPFAEGKRKIKQLDTSLVYTYSGITNDGVKFGERIKERLMEEKHRTGITLPISRLIEDEQFSNGLEVMRYGKRASGVSIILLGIEKREVKLIEMSPTGEVTPCFACCIGARAQSARTVLDAKGNEILNLSDEDLLFLGMDAFKNAIVDEDILRNNHYTICRVSVQDGVVFPSEFS